MYFCKNYRCPKRHQVINLDVKEELNMLSR
nr:MAG TPA: hypothetical protein [Caudoviricetes sp.]